MNTDTSVWLPGNTPSDSMMCLRCVRAVRSLFLHPASPVVQVGNTQVCHLQFWPAGSMAHRNPALTSPFSLTLSAETRQAAGYVIPPTAKAPQDCQVPQESLQTISAEHLRGAESAEQRLQENDENQNLYSFHFQVIQK